MKENAGLTTIKEILECSVCMEEFNDPRILPKCGHIFCYECLEKIADCDPYSDIKCPKCRQMTVGIAVSQLNKPIEMNEIQERINALLKK